MKIAFKDKVYGYRVFSENQAAAYISIKNKCEKKGLKPPHFADIETVLK